MQDLMQNLRSVVELEVQAGFASRDEIIEIAVDYLLDHYDYSLDYIIERATRLTDRMLAVHFAQQHTWLDATDCDRLEEAFAELDRHGIVARQNFACCQSCGHAEIWEAIDDALQYRPVLGYVFFHQQDTDNAVNGGYLYLAYGAVDGSSNGSLRVGHEVVAALERAGLHVEWSGDLNKRICIPALHWQRRRLPPEISRLL